jgi:multiple sugar transport system permease protein
MNNLINRIKTSFKHIPTEKIRKFFLGKNLSDGLIFRLLTYLLLISIGFVYLYPMLYMLSFSFMDVNDIINPMVSWVPTKLYLDNYYKALITLDYWDTLLQSLLVTLIPATIQTIVCSLVGYGFARYNFKFKKLLLVMVLITFIIPAQVYTIPKYVMFNQLGFLENPLSIIVPSLFGQGVNSAIFILIFYQFFRIIPAAFFEAAEIEGAGDYKIFFRISVPLAIPSYITSFLFGFVWYWNETYISSLFLGSNFQSMQIKLAYFVSEYSTSFPSEETARLNEGIRLAATLLIILPMLIVYFIMQRYFIEGVEKSGIAGE